MKRPEGESVVEPQRNVPVYGTCDVLVVGGGPAGFAAAVAAAREGADVVLMERYGYLGGLATGGLVFWIDRMTDWEGNLVVSGIGQQLIQRCGVDATLGPPREQWGSKDPKHAAYWGVRTSAQRGTVNWSPTVDPEVMKLVSNDMVREAGVHTLFHCWAVAAAKDANKVTGVIFESKEGRYALLASVVIDCTGDGDIFHLAGAEYDDDFDAEGAHARLNTSFRFGNVDMRRYLDFRMIFPDKHSDLMRAASADGVNLQAHATPYDSVALFMSPKMSGFSAVNIADLTAVEFISRDAARAGLAWYRNKVPGFERAWILDTASQIGTRHARRLKGVARVTIDDWRKDGTAADSIGLCPGLTPEFPTLEIPYASLVPAQVDGMLAAGRNLSADKASHGPLREVPECWVMGQGAGVAAALAIRDRVALRNVSVPDLQTALKRQDVPVERPEIEVAKPVAGEASHLQSMHYVGDWQRGAVPPAGTRR
ncbi:MAG TPA: FAD-dependent oxidoreductase [Dehalococcoidia bacterium]|nr:FAD-dependent oxidoreductase [Dehalococcoidia bacterium]